MAKKRKRASKCTQAIIGKICKLIEGKHNWTDIASILDISRATLFNWKDPKSEYCQPKLVEAIAATKEKMSCGKMKADQHRQSQFHYLKKNIKELRSVDVRTQWPKPKNYKLPKGAKRLPGKNKVPPSMPPLSFTKRDIVEYAAQFLDLKLDGANRKGQLRIACQKRLNELTVEMMVTVKDENQECEPNQQAVKNIVSNCGPKEERWNFDTRLQHEIEPKTIADIAAAVGVGVDIG